jgi:cellulose synthase/poly-beta-1,6-N-acetylglucosamine synthase-like glycosyltransferase
VSRLSRRLDVAVAVPVAAVTAAMGYLTAVTAAALRPARRPVRAGGAPFTDIVIVIPAHDEERLIRDTVTAALGSSYPREHFGVHVVADHCTDATVRIARDAGAEVHEHLDPDARGKGAALRWALSNVPALADAPPDLVVVILDADTIVDASFLAAIDRAAHDGGRVMQAHYAVREPTTSTATALRAAALAVRHYLRPLGVTRLGGSCPLFGNGMAFRIDVLRRLPPSDHLTEDLETALELVEHGETVTFVPDARIEAEMPATLEASRTQHERWEAGRLDLARRHLPSLLRGAVGGAPGRRAVYRHASAEMLLPPLSVLGAATAGTTLLALLRRRTPVARLTAAAGVGNVIALSGHVLAALVLTKAPRAVYVALLRAPGLVLWKLRLLARVVRRPTAARWTRTARNEEAR